MAKGLVIYYSRSGNTEKMAREIAKAMKDGGLDVDTKKAGEVSVDELPRADAIVIGSPVYYGQMAAEIKQILDESVKFHGKLDGKIGAAFASSANIGGGNETTIMGIINALHIHGMIVQGDPNGDHYGPVAIGAPDERCLKQCKRLGKRVAELTKRVCSR